MTPLVALLSGNTEPIALIVILILGALMALFTLRARGGGRMALRPLRAYQRLSELCSQATESAATVFVTLGSSAPEGNSMASAQAALMLLRFVGRNIAHTGKPVRATTCDPSLLPAAQGTLIRAERSDGLRHPRTGSQIGFAGPEPLGMAIEAECAMADDAPLANLLVGDVGAEALLLTETHPGVIHYAGSDDPADGALLQIAGDETVIGEDVLSGGAYLDRPSHMGSLVAQDVLRAVLMVAILVGVVAASIGLWG